MTLTRYKLVIEYDGSTYHGWQRQPDVPSIQQAIEEAIAGFSKQNVTLIVAGRTDAGVHARGQIAHVDFEGFTKPMSGFDIMKAINAHLRNHKISVLKVEEVNAAFHARFDAHNKLYRYTIINRQAPPALDHAHVWHIKKILDVDAMREGAQYLLGRHDFSTFRDSECQANSPIRTLDQLNITQEPYDSCNGARIVIAAQAQSFLHHQVRNIAGTLSLVGLGKWTPKDVRTALQAKDRTKGGPTAPASGLSLIKVDY